MQIDPKTTLIGLLLALATLVVGAGSANAQSRSLSNSNMDPAQSGDSDREEGFDAEMRAKQEIRLAEKQYRDNLGRADLLSVLGKEIEASYKKKNSLDREDLKKLEKLEKLTKGIREAAGGSEDEVESKEKPADLSSALSKMAGAAQQLKHQVQKTPRHVVSTAVIGQANELLELIRLVRNFSSKA
jgi:hypothetical protein